jgi:phenylacetic acid degradation operon negative regulatory protein
VNASVAARSQVTCYTGAVPTSTLRPRSGRSARALLLTVLGEFVLPQSGSIWTSTVIEGLATLDVGERNARQAVARLGDDGLLVAERVGRMTRWHLTERAERLLTDGTRRIYGFAAGTPTWDRRWLVVITSIPEDERAKRHQLRSRLGFAGFGFLGAGIAISPHVEREPAVNEVLRDLCLDRSAVVFVAETGSLVPDAQLIGRAWDLDGLAARYRAFLAGTADREVCGGDAAFAAIVDLVHEWRRFPFEDPEIPVDLLPADWPGVAARALFDERRAAWSPAATRWFRSVEERAVNSTPS